MAESQQRHFLSHPSRARECDGYLSFPFFALTLLPEFSLLKTKVSSEADKKESQEPKILLVDLHDPQSIKSLLCVGGVVLVTVGFYFYYKQSEKRFRSQLEKPRDGIEGSYRMIGYSR